MANHKSAIKRVKQSEQRRLLNKYQAKSTRNAIKELRNTTKKDKAEKLYPKMEKKKLICLHGIMSQKKLLKYIEKYYLQNKLIFIIINVR